MKKLLVCCLLWPLGLWAQDGYWQQQVRYHIQVSLDDKAKTLDGQETLVYKNNSPETLPFIWFHLWANAYKNNQTALFQQLAKDPERKKKLSKTKTGYVNGLSFTVDGQAATIEPHENPAYIDVVKLVLPKPLKSGDSVTIQTPFHVQLPNFFSRSGYEDGMFMICQWYPKPAVFDKLGWHAYPYLDMGEFYSEYGSYDVSIRLPSDYVVGATGDLQTANELSAYKQSGAYNLAHKDAPKAYKSIEGAATKTLRYVQEHVPDFAWFADKSFYVSYDTTLLPSGRIIDVFAYYHKGKDSTLWSSSTAFIKDATQHYSHWIGEYPYHVVQAVEGPANVSSGGMEYPTITLITSPDADRERLDAVITHEVGHNWFMCILGSNEREHTWQDEGLNSYFQFRYEAEKYRANSIFGSALPAVLKEKTVDEFLGLIYNQFSQMPMEEAIETPSYNFSNSENYGMVSYVKAALWMYIVELSTSRKTVDSAFQLYFNQWKFKHPQPEDLKAAFEAAAGKKMDNLFALLQKKGGFN